MHEIDGFDGDCSDTFALGLRENVFVKKALGEEDEGREAGGFEEKSHLVFSPRCNFRCQFCFYGGRINDNEGVDLDGFVEVVNYTLTEFSALVDRFMMSGKSFKFTGGEITLLRNLEVLLKVVKSRGGIIYMDTNGSRPKRVLELVREGLVDVLGISLKGLDEEEALRNSGIRNPNLVWRNPLESIRESVIENSKLVVPVTFVVDNESLSMDRLRRFADLLGELDSDVGGQIRMKVNNYMPTDFTGDTRTPVDLDLLLDMVSSLVEEKPEWVGRTSVMSSPSFGFSQGQDSVTHF